MVDKRAQSIETLHRRLRRLEVLTTALILEDTEYFPDLEYLLRRTGDHPDEELWMHRLVRALEHRRVSEVARHEQTEQTALGELRQFVEGAISEVKSQVSAVRQRADSSHDEVRGFDKRLADSRADAKEQRIDLHAFLAASTLNLDYTEVPLRQFLPVRVYLRKDDPRTIQEVSDALRRFLSEIEFVISDDLPPETGSWFKRFFAKSRQFLSRKDVQERLSKGERALQLKLLDKPQAEVDKNQAEAAAVLLGALDKDELAVCQIGSLVIIRVNRPGEGRKTFVRTLTVRELIFVEQHQRLMKQPEELLDALEDFNCANEKPRGRRDVNSGASALLGAAQNAQDPTASPSVDAAQEPDVDVEQ